ncbi:hypothetical protein FHR92_000756 [Fontibacillus solani]|uniref:Uncharacterized protein n=1 Tax=Fontibacillus solani TaxID=1572857 RepID=A0A7W3XQ72_9BACL|nr:hypothetical protein [Fontibacillus solani]
MFITFKIEVNDVNLSVSKLKQAVKAATSLSKALFAAFMNSLRLSLVASRIQPPPV